MQASENPYQPTSSENGPGGESPAMADRVFRWIVVAFLIYIVGQLGFRIAGSLGWIERPVWSLVMVSGSGFLIFTLLYGAIYWLSRSLWFAGAAAGVMLELALAFVQARNPEHFDMFIVWNQVLNAINTLVLAIAYWTLRTNPPHRSLRFRVLAVAQIAYAAVVALRLYLTYPSFGSTWYEAKIAIVILSLWVFGSLRAEHLRVHRKAPERPAQSDKG